MLFNISKFYPALYKAVFKLSKVGGGGIHIDLTLFFVTYFDTNHQIFTLITKTIIVWIMIIKHFFILHRGIFYSSHSREDFHFTFYPPGFKCVCAPHLKSSSEGVYHILRLRTEQAINKLPEICDVFSINCRASTRAVLLRLILKLTR